MKFTGQLAQPSVSALWSREPLDVFVVTMATGPASRVVDWSGYNAIQIDVFYESINGVALGPYAVLDILWDSAAPINRYEIGFPTVLHNKVSFRVPVIATNATVQINPIATALHADTGTITCTIRGTNAPGFGCQPGEPGVTGLLAVCTNVATAPVPFYYGPATLGFSAGAGGAYFVSYESPFGSNNWVLLYFNQHYPNVWLPAKHLRLQTFAANDRLTVIVPPTIGIGA